MERTGSDVTPEQAALLAIAVDQIVSGALFGEPEGGLRSKQQKPDTEDGWATVRVFAATECRTACSCTSGTTAVPLGRFSMPPQSNGAT